MGEVIHLKGNLLESDCNVIAHQANCRKVMGGGIAYFISRDFPEAYEADKALKVPMDEKYGKYTKAYSNGKLIFNLYAQLYPGRAGTRAEAFGRLSAFLLSLQDAVTYIQDNKQQIEKELGAPIKFGLPYKIGCGLAGGNWEDYSHIIQQVAETSEFDIYLYEL